MSGTISPSMRKSGGEPVVRLVEPALRGKGGRNQQLALAALEVLRPLRRRPGRDH